MKTSAMMLTVFSGFALSACNPAGGERIDSNLECAALISAANNLMLNGKIENDPAFAKRALISSMTFLNAYAIPKGIPEAEAFKEVKDLRGTLIESVPPIEVMNRAERCVKRSPL